MDFKGNSHCEKKTPNHRHPSLQVAHKCACNGRLVVWIPYRPKHDRNLVIKAAEGGVSLNWFVSARLAG